MYRAMLSLFLDLTSIATTPTAPTILLEETAKLLSEVKEKTTDDFRQTFNFVFVDAMAYVNLYLVIRVPKNEQH